MSRTMELAMPIPLRDDFDAAELRRAAKKSKDGGQARRLLARAAIHDGSRRREAAKIGGVTLQIVRDWVLKFNAHDPPRLIAGKAPGQTPRLTTEHRAALARMVEDGPIPAVHGAVRWRLVDLCQWVFEEYSVVVSTQTMSRELRPWTIASCRRGPNITPRRRPRSRILKKLPGAPGGNRAREGRRHRRHRNLVRRRGAHRTEEQDHTALGKAGNASFGAERPAHGLDLYLWRDLPERGQGRRPDPAQVQHRGDAVASGRNRKGHRAGTSCRPHARQSRMAYVAKARRARKPHAPAAPSQMPRTQSGRERVGVHARQLALKPHLPELRRHRRSLLRRLEQAQKSTLARHVHRTARLGASVLISESWYKTLLDKEFSCGV